jgi:RHS repeat-associated protein
VIFPHQTLTDTSGTTLERHGYSAFGEEAAQTSSTTMFTGKPRDTETFLAYFESRQYASRRGLFLTADTHGLGQDPTIPQTWGLYSFVRNNPLRFIDLDGAPRRGAMPDRRLLLQPTARHREGTTSANDRLLAVALAGLRF